MYWNLTKRYRGSWAFGLRHGYGELISIDKLIEPGADPIRITTEPKKKKLFTLL